MIGRDKGSHIRIDDKSVSIFHSMIYVKGNKCILKDLNSKNGTLVNGYRVSDSHKLRDGDKVKIGSTLFTFVHGNLDHSFGIRKLIQRNRFISGGLLFLCVFILSIFISLHQLKAGDSQAVSIEREEQNMTRSTEMSMTQQLPPLVGVVGGRAPAAPESNMVITFYAGSRPRRPAHVLIYVR